MLPAARIIPVPTITAGRALTSGLWVVTGWAFKETTGGAAAAFELIDGRNAAGTPFAPIDLTAGESTRDLIGGNGLACHVGIYVNVTAGSIRGAVWAVPGDEYEGRGWMRGIRPFWAGYDTGQAFTP